MAIEKGLSIIPIINKIDLPTADVQRALDELQNSFNINPDDVLLISAKGKTGLEDILPRIVKCIPRYTFFFSLISDCVQPDWQ